MYLRGSMRELVVRTTHSFGASAGVVWGLMCNSSMEDTSALLFRLGVPQPVACRIVGGPGGVGSERECISDQGVVHQRILVWEPEKRLRFRMERTTLNFGRHVRDLEDTFDLEPTATGVKVTRTTRVWTQGRSNVVRRIPLWMSLRKVHQYVFGNWELLARRAAHGPGSSEPRVPVVPVS
jgi:hypothetical protein